MVKTRIEPLEVDPSPVRRVMVCLDGSGLGERSLPHALALAKALGAPLTLIRVLECPASDLAPADPLQWEIRRREAREYLRELVSQCGDSSVSVDAKLIEGKAAEELCRWSAAHEVDLTVICSHGAGGRSPWTLASTARKLLDRAPGSFLIVPATAEPLDAAATYQKLLVPLDGSALAETALPIAARIAAAHGSELIVAHVVPVPELLQIGPPEAEDVELTDRLRRRNERVARTYADRIRARFSDGRTKLRVILLQGGDVATRLAGLVAREKIDLAVLAAHGAGARLRLPCGRVTSELIASAPVPTLVVRSRPARANRAIALDLGAQALRPPQTACSRV